MSRFYFTYGADGRYPFKGGYTVVDADNRTAAVNVFRGYHPGRHALELNCTEIYTEEEFAARFKDGRCYGVGCHEEIAPLLSSEAALREQLCELRHVLFDRSRTEEEKREALARYQGALAFADRIGSLPSGICAELEREVNRALSIAARKDRQKGKVRS